MVVTCCELLVMLWGLSQWVKLHCKASPQHSFGKSTKPTSMYVLPMMIHFIMNFPHGYLPRYYLKCAVVSDSPSQIKIYSLLNILLKEECHYTKLVRIEYIHRKIIMYVFITFKSMEWLMVLLS